MDTTAREASSAIAPGDILFYIFKYRWAIICLAIAGLVAGAGFYSLYPPLYRSHAKLFVRYVLERSAIDPEESHTSSGGNSRAGNSVINAELEILTSWDLALAAANAVGLARLVENPDSANAQSRGAYRIQRGLRAYSSKGSNVIWVEYTDPDRDIAVAVLDSLVSLYFDKHLEVHRSIGAFAFVSAQSKAIQTRLDETEARLKELKLRSEIVSVAETSSSLHSVLARREAELDAARADLAAQRARVEQFEGKSVSLLEPAPAPDPNAVSRYNALGDRIRALHRERAEMFSVFTPHSAQVKSNERQLEILMAQKADLEQQNPGLAQGGGRYGQNPSQHSDWIAERATLSALEARIKTLEEQLVRVRARAERFVEIAPELAQLERRKEAEAANQRYFESSLERARVDEALDPSKIPNISIVQRPSPASADYGRREAIAAGLAGGGLAAGCGLAIAFGLLFDRTIKRASEIEEKARLAFLSSVPLFKLKARNVRTAQASSVDVLSPGNPTRLIQRHCEAIRDRLILGFELSGKTNIPKLVALTGCAKGAGTSTIAVGLAEALSRTGRGKVLLVDMNLLDRNESLTGHRATPVNDLLRNSSSVPPVAENLYVAIGTSVPAELRRPLAIQIRDLMPHLKSSDFDYVIMDLPSTDESSAALTSAGFVDMVVLVVPAEVVTPEKLRRTYNELVSARGEVAIVFNRERNLLPQFLASNN